MKALSKGICYIFHPLLFPTYGTLFVLAANPNRYGYFGQKIHVVWLIIIFALTFMFPVVWLAMMKGLQMIDNFKLETARERIVPYVATATFYMWTTWMFKPSVNMKVPPNQLVFYMMLGASFAIFIGFFINIFTKISLHTIAMGSFVGLVLTMIRFSTYDLRLAFICIIILAGIVGTARLLQKAHSMTEILLGYFVGFTGQFIAFSIAPKFF